VAQAQHKLRELFDQLTRKAWMCALPSIRWPDAYRAT
jgi:hypothetical protein